MRIKIFLLFVLFYIYKVKLNYNDTTISGEVKYGFIQNSASEQDKLKSKELYNFLNKMNEMSLDLEFVLKFNFKESYFSLEEQMESDNQPMVISFAKNIVSKGAYYYNSSDDILLREANNFENYTLVKSKPSQKKWNMTKEKKRIDKYLCYKATQIKIVENNSGKHEFEIEAWYCPEIPVPFGPNEFNGLPGLILELKDSHYTLYAKKIKLYTKKELKIKRLESKNVISDREYDDYSKKIYKSIGKKIKN